MSQETLKIRFNKRVNEQIELKNLLEETRQANLLIEVMSDQDLKKAEEIINKFQALKGKGLKSLDVALDNATNEINKYTGGGPLDAAWSKMKATVGFKNPLVKFTTFASALEAGFKQLPTILKNNLAGVDLKANADKSLNDLVTDEGKKNTLLNNVMKALSPKGFLGAFKKVPYVDKEALVQDILAAPIKNLNTVTQQVISGVGTDQIATDLQDTAAKAGGPETKGAQPAQPAKGTAGTSGTKVAGRTGTATGTSPTGQSPQRPAQATAAVVDTVWKKVGTMLQDAAGNERRARDILKVLADEGLLKV